MDFQILIWTEICLFAYFDFSDFAVLPELPLPTPLNQYGSGSILLHPGLEDSARHILQTPDHGLASRVAQALQAQPAEFLAPATAGATPTALALPLAQAVHQHNPQVGHYLLEVLFRLHPSLLLSMIFTRLLGNVKSRLQATPTNRTTTILERYFTQSKSRL